MDLAHEKTSFSPIISEAIDRANGIYAAHTGELIVQGARGLPLFVGVMQFTIGARDRAPATDAAARAT